MIRASNLGRIARGRHCFRSDVRDEGVGRDTRVHRYDRKGQDQNGRD